MLMSVFTNEYITQRNAKAKGLTNSRMFETVWTLRDSLGNTYQLTYFKEREIPLALYDKLDKDYFESFDKDACNQQPMIANLWSLEFTNIAPKMGTHTIYFRVKNGVIDIIYIVASVGKKGAMRILTSDRYLYTYDLFLVQVFGSMIAYGYFL